MCDLKDLLVQVRPNPSKDGRVGNSSMPSQGAIDKC